MLATRCRKKRWRNNKTRGGVSPMNVSVVLKVPEQAFLHGNRKRELFTRHRRHRTHTFAIRRPLAGDLISNAAAASEWVRFRNNTATSSKLVSSRGYGEFQWLRISFYLHAPARETPRNNSPRGSLAGRSLCARLRAAQRDEKPRDQHSDSWRGSKPSKQLK